MPWFWQNIKKLLKIPYSKSHVSMAVHRVGRTLLLDELDIQELFMRSSQVSVSSFTSITAHVLSSFFLSWVTLGETSFNATSLIAYGVWFLFGVFFGCV